MGYSCAVKAGDTLQMTLNNANGEDLNTWNHSNTWENNGNKYFWERGREQEDGSITGTIWKFTGEYRDGNPLAYKYGSLKILPDGKVKAWAGMPKNKIVDKKPMFQII